MVEMRITLSLNDLIGLMPRLHGQMPTIPIVLETSRFIILIMRLSFVKMNPHNQRKVGHIRSRTGALGTLRSSTLLSRFGIHTSCLLCTVVLIISLFSKKNIKHGPAIIRLNWILTGNSSMIVFWSITAHVTNLQQGNDMMFQR